MKKLKQALSLSLALVLSLALALPTASAAGVEDYKYVKFSNKPIGRTQLTYISDISEEDNESYLVWVFPDDTNITITVPDGGSLHRNSMWSWGSGDSYPYVVFSDWDEENSKEINFRKTDTWQIGPALVTWTVYDSVEYWDEDHLEGGNAGEIIEEVCYCTQSGIAAFVADGGTSVMQPMEQPTTPIQPQQPSVQISDWAKDQVSRATANGLVADGLGNDYRTNITRAQFAATAVKLYEAMSGQTAPATGNSPFTDTSDPAVIQAQALGFVSGVGDGKFAPDSLVTREQAASMLSRVYTKLGGNIPTVTATTFADNGSVSAWARDAVAFMSDKGIVSGTGNNNFTPQGNASIEQALSIALRMFENLK